MSLQCLSKMEGSDQEGPVTNSLDHLPRLDEPPTIDFPELFAPMLLDREPTPVTGLLIGGKWTQAQSGETQQILSPIDGSVIAHAQQGDEADVERAVEAAVAARGELRSMTAAERLHLCERAAEILRSHLDAVAHAIVVDLGKTPSAARSETSTTVRRLELVREEVRKIFGEYLPGDWVPGTEGQSGVVVREPLGTVAAVGPFNYPLFIPASKVIPALAAGNTVVAKAPSDDPLPLLMFARIFEEAGLPPGALNVITGPGSAIGGALASHDGVSMVSFTGSTAAGHALAKAAIAKPIHLELGGNASGIVLDDADLDEIVDLSVTGAFKNAGQRCSALSRILVQDSIYDEYVDRAVASARDWTVGDPRTGDVDIGPLVNQGAVKNVQALVADAREKGAELAMGGGVEGTYHEPTVLLDVPHDADIVWEETFGPVLTIVRVADEDAAIELSNRSRYGLDSAVFTASLDRAWRVASALEVGMVAINDSPAHGVGHFPFGGRKPASGVGREGLGYSIDECTAIKTVVLPTG